MNDELQLHARSSKETFFGDPWLRPCMAMYDLRVIVAVVVIYQLDIRTCTAQNCSESFIASSICDPH